MRARQAFERGKWVCCDIASLPDSQADKRKVATKIGIRQVRLRTALLLPLMTGLSDN